MTRRLLLLCLALSVLVLPVRAQNEAFDVASIKPSNPNTNPADPLSAIPFVLPALDRLTAQNATLRILVMAAYQKQPYEVVGGPPWQNSDKFDINARATGGKRTTDQLLEMLKGLLAERFKLKVHTEKRDVPIYALVVARSDGKLGSKLKPSADVCPDIKEQQQAQLEQLAKGGLASLASLVGKPGETKPCGFSGFQPETPGSIGFRASGQTMSTLTLLLTQFVGRPVVDKTGLTGAYDFEFAVDIQTLLRVAASTGVNVPTLPAGFPEGPSLMTQIQETLGLKLDSQRGPGDVLVIDSAELPTPD